MPTATTIFPISSNFPHMATTGGRTTRRRSRGDTFTEDEGAREKDMPATKRRREDKKSAAAGTSFGTGRTVNVPTAQTKKSKPTYDEEDDGFVFTRKPRATTTRSAKLSVPELPKEQAPLPITPTRPKNARTAKVKPLVKKPEQPPPQPPPDHSLKNSIRPSILQQDENTHSHHFPNRQDVQAVRVPKTWSFEQSMEDAGLNPISPPPVFQGRRRGASKERVAKVVIPLTDTPIIQRNKQFRKEGGGGSSSRRSSLGLRGRRASSLIDNGQVAEPHPELPPEEFYKHIDAELIEPRRMKQLLVWCAKRASSSPSSNQNGSDGNANAIARIIQEEVMKDLLEKAELSNWFKREDKSASTIEKKPNPRNVDNLAKVQECESTLQRLKDEQRTWELLIKKAESGGTLPIPNPLPDPPLPEKFRLKLQLQPPSELPPPSAPSTSTPAPAEKLEPPLLTDREDTFLTNTLPILSSTVTSTASLLDSAESKVEHNVDLLDDGLHQLAQLNKSAEELAGGLLKEAEETLRKRDVKIKRETGTEGLGLREILRSITRMDA